MPPVLLFAGDRTFASLLRPAARAVGYALVAASPLHALAHARNPSHPLSGIVLGSPDARLETALRRAVPDVPVVTLPRPVPCTACRDAPLRPDEVMRRLETALRRSRT